MHLGEIIGAYLLNVGAIFFLIIPIVALSMGALQTERSILGTGTHLLPHRLTLENLGILVGAIKPTGLTQGLELSGKVAQFPRAFANSLIVALTVTIGTVLFGSLTAYSIVRLRWRGSLVYLYLVLATRMLPEIALVIPVFLTLRNLGLLNSLPGLIVAELGFFLPFASWIMVGYFHSMGGELEEAARIDGCTRFGAFLRAVMPLSAPGLAACAIVIFLFSWHDLIIPLIVVSSEHVATLPVLMASFVGDYFLRYTLMNAVALLSMVPTALLVLLLQRYAVAGLTSGGVKG